MVLKCCSEFLILVKKKFKTKLMVKVVRKTVTSVNYVKESPYLLTHGNYVNSWVSIGSFSMVSHEVLSPNSGAYGKGILCLRIYLLCALSH